MKTARIFTVISLDISGQKPEDPQTSLRGKYKEKVTV